MGTGTPKSGVIDLGAEERLVSRIVGVRDERDARRDELGARRVDLDETGCICSGAGWTGKANAVIRAGLFAILELCLSDRGPEIDVPERRRFELIREAFPHETQERQLRQPLRTTANRRVRHRPVDRQAEVSPQVLEGLLVFRRQPRAQLDEIRARYRNRMLTWFLRRREAGLVGQRRIAADAEVVLHAAFCRQPVVIPSHRIEHGLAAHPLKPRDDIGVRVGEDVADVQ